MTLSAPSKYAFLNNYSSDTLSNFGIKLVNKSNNGMVININEAVNTVAENESQRFTIRIEICKNDHRYRQVTLRQTITTDKGDTQEIDANIRRLVRRGTIALMSRINLDDYFN